MDSLSRYHLAPHEDGSWHVIDARTGGPAEIKVNGIYFVFWKLPKEEAERWSVFLNHTADLDLRGRSNRPKDEL